jgi:hypothetical protein
MSMYRSKMGRMGLVLLVCAAIGLAGTSKAEAAFVAAVCNDAACDGVGDVIVADGTGGDVDFLFGGAAAGIIVTGGTVGGYTFALQTSQTKPAFGSAAAPKINLAYNLNGSGDIWLYAGDTGYTGQGTVTLTVNSTTSDQTTTGYALGGDDNGTGANGLNLSPVLITIGPTAGVFSTTAVDGPVGAAPYALAAGVKVSRTGTGASSGDATVTVPEPFSMALFGMGLFGAGLASRRRARKQ